MRTLNVSASDLELDKFGIEKDKISFSEFVDLISRELTLRTLNRSIALADQYGLSSMTMDQISREVKAARKNAKNRN